MPYSYNSEIKTKLLAQSFQSRNEIPLSIKMNYFRFLAESMEKIFIKHQNNEKKIRELCRKIRLSEPGELLELSQMPEEDRIIKLYHGDIETFKQAIGDVSLTPTELKKYLEVSQSFVFCHLAKISCELYDYSISKNKSILHKTKKKSKDKIPQTLAEIKESDEARYIA